MKIVVTVGMPGSGKSSHPKKFGEKYGYPLLETHTPLYEELKKRELGATIENIKKVTKELKKISDSYLTEKLMEIVKTRFKDKKLVFLSGLRSPSEIELLNKEFGEENVYVIAFVASRISRYTRHAHPKKGFDFVGKSSREEEKELKEKMKEDQLMADFKEFIKKEEKDLGWGQGDVIALAEYYIVTESERYPKRSFEESHKDFEEMVKEILREK